MSKLKFITPTGSVKFPYITKQDKKGKFSIALTFNPKDIEFQALIAKLTEAEKEFEKKYRGKPYFKKDYRLDESGEKIETGLVLMQFKTTFPLISDEDSKIFDAKGTKIKNDIGWGSKCKVSFVLSAYDQDGNCGITKYLQGIQVIELQELGSSASGLGFKEENGYTSPEKEQHKPIKEEEIAWDEDIK